VENTSKLVGNITQLLSKTSLNYSNFEVKNGALGTHHTPLTIFSPGPKLSFVFPCVCVYVCVVRMLSGKHFETLMLSG
jgi:hypothetical protein